MAAEGFIGKSEVQHDSAAASPCPGHMVTGVLLAVGPTAPLRTGRPTEGRMDHLRRRPREHALLPARPDHARQLRQAGSGVAVQDRRAWTEPGINFEATPDGRGHAVLDGWSRRAVGRSTRRPANCDGCTARTKTTRRGGCDASRAGALSLDRRTGCPHRLRHAGAAVALDADRYSRP